MNTQKIWLITGCSTGLGRALAIYAASQGDKVVATVRKESQFAALQQEGAGGITPILMDVQYGDQISKGVEEVVNRFGRIDILVNNAGYGSIGPVEEIEPNEVKRQFEVNVFAPTELCRLTLPHMRRQKSGHIINITSIAGLRGTAGLGVYNASKFALEGLGEALAMETAPLGIHVTNVEPGPFRTKWAGESATFTDVINEDYRESAGKFMNMLQGLSGQQPGDPDKAAKAIFDLTRLDKPPVHLPLGKVAYNGAYSKLNDLKSELEAYEHLGLPTDFED